MADLVICKKNDIVNIADAIREKTGSSATMKLQDMPSSITAIEGSSVGITSVGIYSVESQDSYSSYLCITMDGKCETKYLNSTYEEIAAPSFIIVQDFVRTSDTGYCLVSGGEYVEIGGNYAIFVDGTKPVVFEYVPAKDEPE